MSTPETTEPSDGPLVGSDESLTILGTVTFILGHAVAFFSHVLWPALVAMLGVSGQSIGLSIPPVVNVAVQSVALLFLVGAWFMYLQKIRLSGYSTRRLIVGFILTPISIFVVYQWTKTILGW